ncbi:zf-RVT domain-containing protein, partial [Cephalotus follicularis]
GNGELFSLWYDPWVHGESVHALYGHRVMHDTGLDRTTKIKDILWEGQWCWPQTSADLIDLQQRVSDIPTSSGPDSIFWDKVGVSFSTARAWLSIRTTSNKVPWHCLVWHPQRIPKHAFCLWLALRGAHRTRDKLVTVGVVQNATCAFHCGMPESNDHLFFQCPYSMKVWKEVLSLCDIVSPILPWTDEVEWLITMNAGNRFHQSLRKLAFAATVYHIWIERNNRCFNNLFLPYQEIVLKVRKDVSGKLTAGNNAQRCEQHHRLCVSWDIPLADFT